MKMTKIYTYQAEYVCKKCGEQIKENLAENGEKPDNPDNLSSYDSMDFPKPAMISQVEVDSPEHCSKCGELIEFKLTPSGVDYIIELVVEYLNLGHGDKNVLGEWVECYDQYKDIAKLKNELIEMGVDWVS